MRSTRIALVALLAVPGCAESVHSSAGTFVSDLQVRGDQLAVTRCELTYDVIADNDAAGRILLLVVLLPIALVANLGSVGGGGGGSTSRAVGMIGCATSALTLPGAVASGIAR